jgi:hypothetical protein
MPKRAYKWIILLIALSFTAWFITHTSAQKSAPEIFKAELIARGDKLNLAEIAIPPSKRWRSTALQDAGAFFLTQRREGAGTQS